MANATKNVGEFCVFCSAMGISIVTVISIVVLIWTQFL